MLTSRTDPSRVGDIPIASAGANGASGDGFDAWRESMRPSQDIEPVQKGCGERRVSSTGWVLGDLLFNDLGLSPVTYHRRPCKVGDYLLLRFYQEGHGRGVFDDAAFCTGPGEVHLFDQARESRGVTRDWHRMTSVFVPYAMVRYEPRRHPGHIHIGADMAVGRMLRSAMASLAAELPLAGPADASALAAGFAGLVEGLLLTGDPSASLSREFDVTRRLAMRRYLDERLDDPTLGVASLCAAFGASRATIYRDFADEGGVARFVTRRRLERAFRDLASLPPERGRVRRVAERWGFDCPYHFSRAFRRQFALWPSEVFEACRSAERFTPPASAGAVAAPGMCTDA